MARTTTTLNGAVIVDQNTITVTSATGFAAKMYILVDQEVMQVASSYVSGTAIPVVRGVEGTATQAHVTGANVSVYLPSDSAGIAPQEFVTYPIAARAKTLISVTATSTLTLPLPGSDAIVVLNGTSVITLTIPVPTKDMDGTQLVFLSNGAAAHVLTFTGGIGGAGSNYVKWTNNATAPSGFNVYACNGLWIGVTSTPAAGTVTNITGTISS